MEEYGLLCGTSCACENIKIDISKSQCSRLPDTEFSEVHTFDDVAWMKACKNGCKKPCKKHAPLFLKPKDGVKVKVQQVKIDADAQVGMEIHVDDVPPSVWVCSSCPYRWFSATNEVQWYRPY